MNEKILVAYSSKRGSTAQVAEFIGKELCAKGESVDVLPISKIESLDGYKGFIVGSAIRAGKWVPEATKFVEKNKDAFACRPVAYFIVCMTLASDKPGASALVADYLENERILVKPVSEGNFAGKYVYKELPLFFRILGKALKIPDGDFRNWDVIKKWADQVQPLMNR